MSLKDTSNKWREQTRLEVLSLVTSAFILDFLAKFKWHDVEKYDDHLKVYGVAMS